MTSISADNENPTASFTEVGNSIGTSAKSQKKPRPNNRGRRGLTKKDRITTKLNWHSSERAFNEAVTAVQRSGVLLPIKEHLRRRRDAEARVSTQGALVALVINGRHEGHKGAATSVMRLLNSFSSTKRLELGMPSWREVGAYDRTQRILAAIAGALDQGWEHLDRESGEITRCDWTWFWTAMLRSPIPDDIMAAMRGSIGIAVDGTEVESCAMFQFAGGDRITIDGDGPYAETANDSDIAPGKMKKQAAMRKAPMKAGWPKMGLDGRKVYTKDIDARAGHRSANANHDKGPYIGRELHLAVALPAVSFTDGVTKVTFKPDVPQVVLAATLVPAGSHPANSVIAQLLALHEEHLANEVLADRGYTQLDPATFHFRLQRAGIDLYMDLKDVHRGEAPGIGAARQIDGNLFAEVPDELVNLTMPTKCMEPQERARLIGLFDRRAVARYGRNKAPGPDGVTTHEDPFSAGRLRSTSIPSSMRNSVRAPLIEAPEGKTFHTGIVSAGADMLPRWQRTLYGTTAWHTVYGDRSIIETVNSHLHGGGGALTEISRGYTKSLDSGRITLYMVHTITGYNHRVIENWISDHRPEVQQRRRANDLARPTRKARRSRVHRYEDLPPFAGTSPPR